MSIAMRGGLDQRRQLIAPASKGHSTTSFIFQFLVGASHVGAYLIEHF